MKPDFFRSRLRKPTAALLALATGLFLTSHLFAQIPTAANNKVNTGMTEAADPWSTSAEKMPPARTKTTGSSSIRDYQDQVSQLQGQFDAYSNELAEAMLGLGLAYQKEGDHKEAIASMQQALQINRVNNGLHSISKIPLIEHLIVSYAAKEEWEAVGDSYSKMQQLYYRNYQFNDPMLLPAFRKLTKWHWFAFAKRVDDQPINHLLIAREMILNAIGIIKSNYGENDLRQLDLYSALVMTEWYLTLLQGESKEILMQSDSSGFQGDFDNRFSDPWRPLQNTYTSGKRHIEEMIRVTQNNPETPQATAAKASVILADWHLMFKKKMAADEVYKQVWSQISTLDNPDSLVQEIFGKLVSLPDINLSDSWYFDSQKAVASEVLDQHDVEQNTKKRGTKDISVDLTFALSTTGRATGSEVIRADPEITKSNIMKAKRRLRYTRFRPRYADGVAVQTTGENIRYFFKQDPEKALAEAQNEK